MKTINNDGLDSPNTVLDSLHYKYPEPFAIYQEYMSLLDKLASNRVKRFVEHLQNEFVQIIKDDSIDEYNHALQLTLLASKYRDIGYLPGSITLTIVAEEYARFSRYSTPSIWCEIAKFYASIPLLEEAFRCILNAEDLISLADLSNDAILPGDASGRWIPEMNMDAYTREIASVRTDLAGISINPVFCLSKTISLIGIPNASIGEEFRKFVAEWEKAFPSNSLIKPHIV